MIENTPDTLNDTCLDVRLNTLKGTDTTEFFDWDISIQFAESNGATYQMVQNTNAALAAANPGVNKASIFVNPPATVTAVAFCPQPTPP